MASDGEAFLIRALVALAFLACGTPPDMEGGRCPMLNEKSCAPDHNSLLCVCGRAICNPGDAGVWAKLPLDPC